MNASAEKPRPATTSTESAFIGIRSAQRPSLAFRIAIDSTTTTAPATDIAGDIRPTPTASTNSPESAQMQGHREGDEIREQIRPLRVAFASGAFARPEHRHTERERRRIHFGLRGVEPYRRHAARGER